MNQTNTLPWYDQIAAGISSISGSVVDSINSYNVAVGNAPTPAQIAPAVNNTQPPAQSSAVTASGLQIAGFGGSSLMLAGVAFMLYKMLK